MNYFELSAIQIRLHLTFVNRQPISHLGLRDVKIASRIKNVNFCFYPHFHLVLLLILNLKAHVAVVVYVVVRVFHGVVLEIIRLWRWNRWLRRRRGKILVLRGRLFLLSANLRVTFRDSAVIGCDRVALVHRMKWNHWTTGTIMQHPSCPVLGEIITIIISWSMPLVLEICSFHFEFLVLLIKPTCFPYGLGWAVFNLNSLVLIITKPTCFPIRRKCWMIPVIL